MAVRLAGFLPWPFAILAVTAATAQPIPQAKLDRIKRAVDAMNLRPQMDALIENAAALRARRIFNDNPDLPDSVQAGIRDAVASAYRDHLDDDRGLYGRLYLILDRYLTEDDLKFAVDYRGSDSGRRFAQVLPRILHDASDAIQSWQHDLEPEIESRIRARFANREFRFGNS